MLFITHMLYKNICSFSFGRLRKHLKLPRQVENIILNELWRAVAARTCEYVVYGFTKVPLRVLFFIFFFRREV